MEDWGLTWYKKLFYAQLNVSVHILSKSWLALNYKPQQHTSSIDIHFSRQGPHNHCVSKLLYCPFLNKFASIF